MDVTKISQDDFNEKIGHDAAKASIHGDAADNTAQQSSNDAGESREENPGKATTRDVTKIFQDDFNEKIGHDAAKAGLHGDAADNMAQQSSHDAAETREQNPGKTTTRTLKDNTDDSCGQDGITLDKPRVNYRGVCRNLDKKKWQARLGRRKGERKLYLGTFAAEEEAARAYDITMIRLKGAEAKTNFPLSDYDIDDIFQSEKIPIGEGASKRIKETSADEVLLWKNMSTESHMNSSGIDLSREEPAGNGKYNLPKLGDDELFKISPYNYDPNVPVWVRNKEFEFLKEAEVPPSKIDLDSLLTDLYGPGGSGGGNLFTEYNLGDQMFPSSGLQDPVGLHSGSSQIGSPLANPYGQSSSFPIPSSTGVPQDTGFSNHLINLVSGSPSTSRFHVASPYGQSSSFPIPSPTEIPKGTGFSNDLINLMSASPGTSRFHVANPYGQSSSFPIPSPTEVPKGTGFSNDLNNLMSASLGTSRYAGNPYGQSSSFPIPNLTEVPRGIDFSNDIINIRSALAGTMPSVSRNNNTMLSPGEASNKNLSKANCGGSKKLMGRKRD